MKKRFTFKPPVIDNTHYFLGSSSVPKIILQPDGDWSAYLPDPEDQNRRGIETYDCTGFGTLNAIEILMYRLFGEKVNYSDRWVGIIAGTGEGGNDPHTVCEAIRKYGLIPEDMLPFSDDIKDINEYYSFKGANKEACYEAGRKWLEQYDFKHEWVYSGYIPEDEKKNNRKISLKMSPLGISVYAWGQDSNGIFVAFSSPNHWTTDTALVDDCDIAFDSYLPVQKKVKQNIEFCKRFYIAKKEAGSTPENNWFLIDILKKIVEACKSILQLDKQILDVKVKEQPKEDVKPEPTKVETPTITKADLFVQALKNSIGHDLSPKNLAPQEFSCAESMSNILNSVFPDFPKDITYTPDLFKQLKAYPQYFKPTLTPSKGCVIISPTVKDTHGHVGGMLNETDIVSTSSLTGTMESNYNIERWVKKYKIDKGLRVDIFEIIN